MGTPDVPRSYSSSARTAVNAMQLFQQGQSVAAKRSLEDALLKGQLSAAATAEVANMLVAISNDAHYVQWVAKVASEQQRRVGPQALTTDEAQRATAMLYVDLGQTLLMGGAPSLVISLLESVQNEIPVNAAMVSLHADALHALGQTTQALAVLDKAATTGLDLAAKRSQLAGIQP
jgi:hypothetical protein